MLLLLAIGETVETLAESSIGSQPEFNLSDSEDEETEGLDLNQHNERGYDL